MTESKPRILLVDDEPSILKTVGKWLEVSGYEVMVAVDGEHALERAKTERPDLIVLDLMLPKLSGLKVCGLLKQDAQYQQIPIIIFTGKDQVVDDDACRSCGADGYVTKTQGTMVLLEQIRTLLKPRSSDSAPA